MSRANYAIKTIASAAHLLGSCSNVGQIDAIVIRMNDMLVNVWGVEHRALKANTPKQHLPVAIQAFWDSVSAGLVTVTDAPCYSFQAIYGEEANPPGWEGVVHIRFQASRSVTFFYTTLTIYPPPKVKV